MQKVTNKILAIIVMLIMLAINLEPVTVQAAEDVKELQETITNESNVEFDARVNGDYKTTAQVGEKIELEFGVKVSKTGYVKDAVIEIENSNFKIIESSMENFNGLTANGAFKLNDVRADEEVIAKVKAEFDKTKNVKESDFNKECKVTFKAVYINDQGVERKVEKTLKEKVEWQVKDVSAEIYQELVRYIRFDNKTMISYRINQKIKDNKIPAKVSALQTLIPEINKSKPSIINVIGDYDEYKEEDGVLVITKKEGEQKGEKEEKEYSWKTDKSYIVTYIYDAQEDLNNISVTSKANYETVLNEKVENAITTQNDVTNEIGSIIELDLEGTASISKGYMYTNLVRANKLDTEFNTAYKINVGTKDVVDKVVLTENQYSFNDTRIEIINSKINTHKDELIKVLGEDGYITVKDKEGNDIAVLNKDTEEAEINTQELYIETTKPISEGVLTINVDKKLDNSLELTREDIKAIQTLNTASKLYGFIGDDVISAKDFTTTIKMEEPVSSADIAMEPRMLSTTVENQDVRIDVRLNNASAKDALYTDPIIEVDLPEQVENINIKSADVIYENELVPAEIKVEGNKIRATLKGTQTEYNDDGIINGSIIRINANVSLDRLATSADEKVILKYGNSATKEEGTREIDTEVVAPVDFITLHGMKINGTELVAMEDDKEVEIAPGMTERKATIAGKVINNLKRNADGFMIVGKIPTEGMTNLLGEAVATTETASIASSVKVNNINAKVYYSDNVNEPVDGIWNELPAITSKAFKIVAEEDVPHGKEVDFEYELNLPESLSSGEEMHATYGVVYNTNAVDGEKYNVVEAKKVGVYTESDDTISIRAEVYDTNTGEEIGENDHFYAGEYVTYKIKVTNNGRNNLSHVVLDANINQSELFFIEKKGDMKDYGIYTDFLNQETSTRSVDFDLNKGESKEYTFDCVVRGYNKNDYEEYLENNSRWHELEDRYNEIKNSQKEESEYTDEERNIVNEYENKKAWYPDRNETVKMMISVNYGRVKSFSIENKKDFRGDLFGNITSKSSKVNGPEQEITIFVQVRNFINANSREFNLELNIPNQLDIESIYMGYKTYNKNEISEFYRNHKLTINGDKITTTTTSEAANRPYITDNGTETVKITFKVKRINRIREEAVIAGNINIFEDNNVAQIYKLNDTVFVIEDNSVVEATQTVNVGSRVEDTVGLIRFEIKLRNGSEFGKDIRFKNDKFDYLEVTDALYEVGGESRTLTKSNDNFEVMFYLEPDEQATIIIDTKPIRYNKGVEKQIVNQPVITSQTGSVSINSVNFTLVGTYEKIEDDLPDYKNHAIRGVVWIDENNNGIRDNEELRSKGNLVRLYSDGEIVKQTETDVNGEYVFDNLESDGIKAYYVLVDYDTTNYRVSDILNKDNESINNDFTEQTFDGKTIASSRKVVLINKDIINIDLALVNRNTFDFKIDKYVSKVTITNPEYSAREYRFVNSKTGKVEVPTKNIENSTVVIEYKIKVTNIGREPGYVKSIGDYMPNGTEFNSELNSNWYKTQDDTLYNTKLANKELSAGESAEVLLVLVRKINGENLGVIRNTTEITELYSNNGYQDANSTPGNKAEGEDDMDSADLFILGSTGKDVASIMIISIFILTIVGIAIYEIRKENKKIIKKEEIANNE